MVPTNLFRLFWVIVLPIVSLASTPLLAQDKYVPGQVLVRLAPEAAPNDFLSSSQGYDAGQWKVLAHTMKSGMNVWLLETQQTGNEFGKALNWLDKQPQVLKWQLNHYVADRDQALTLPYGQPLQLPYPNDPKFNLQWNLDNQGQNGGTPGVDLGMVQAWETTTGGVSAAGDTVVVAVIDGGMCPYCNDWGNNLWTNNHEIPNDGIDNDGNGYFDDYRGWNVNAQNDEITGYAQGHGTSVASVIAAKGNDNIGISGIMWDTKLMFVAGTSGASTTESEILAAYEYVYQARKTYNETQGQKGAFVVAVNCSFGIDYGTTGDSPLWCAVLDQLGTVGILTVGAVSNIDVDIDEVGDIPTTCPSDFLVTTTSINYNNQIAPSSGFGLQSVDLAAFGQEIYTLMASSPPYGYRSGTSFAAPQVAGALGLLYTAPCHNLMALAKSDPAAAAQWAKQLVLESVTSVPDLQGISVTGGRLQVDALLEQYEGQCQSCPAPYWLLANDLTTAQANLSWVNSSIFEQVDLRWRKVGDTDWAIIQQVAPPYMLTGLATCTAYEYCLRAQCGTETSAWTAPAQFTTDGCCLPPVVNSAIAISPDSAKVFWPNITAANSYTVRYRSVGSANWNYISGIAGNSTLLTGLTGCTYYEVQMHSACGNLLTDASPSYTFQTKGCGACYDLAYCTAKAENANYEWIQKVEIGTWSHASDGHQGYQNFSGSANIPLLDILPLMVLDATVTPAFASSAYFEMFRIYVDFDLDGDFLDPGELVFDPGFAHDGPITAQFTAPYFPGWGISKMRVVMKYKASNDPSFPEACNTFEYGQVEDFCVRLLQNSTPSAQTTSAEEAQVAVVSPNPFHDFFEVKLGANMALDHYTLTDLAGRTIISGKTNASRGSVVVQGLEHLPAGMYLLHGFDQNNQKRVVARAIKL
jgi:serine protease